MEIISKGNIKVGDYIKAVYWKTTYFQVTGFIDSDGTISSSTNEVLFAKKWFDFNKNGNFIGIDRIRSRMNYHNFKYYRLTEEEYFKIVGKYLIADTL
jgi:hypothetical protein